MIYRVVVVCKNWIDASPTVLTVAHALRRLGKEVRCICSASRPKTRTDLERAGIRVDEIYKEDPLPTNPLAKMVHYVTFRKRAWQLLNQDKDAIVWVARIDTAIALGRRLLQRPYVVALHELHDKYPLYQRAIGLYASNATRVVVPEFCRATILRCWHGLKQTPFVLPNRPVSHPRTRFLPVSDKVAANTLASIPKQRRILLYQGGLGGDRNLEPVAKAIHELGNDYCLLVMGRDSGGALGWLQRACPGLVHIPWVLPPMHLEVTSHAFMGIAFYRYDSLNSIFCAPNKIWEYTGFGIPLLCQDIPGLRFTVGTAEAGVCVDTSRSEEIVAGIREIEISYDHYNRKAGEFYESIDTEKLIAELIDEI